MKTNMYIELPPIVKDRFNNEAEEAFKAISLKV